MWRVLVEDQVGALVEYLSDPGGLTKQAEGIGQMKKSEARGNLGLAVLLLVLGAIGTIYGIAVVFGGLHLPFGLVFLIVGPLMLWGAISMLSRGASGAATASQVSFATDLDELCRSFYENALCRKPTDFLSKGNLLVDVSQYIPLPVIENYKKTGWNAYLGTAQPKTAVQPIECTRCHKTAGHSEAYTSSIPVSTQYREEYRDREPAETQNLIRNLYLACQACGSVVCYECVAYCEPKTLRFLCPVCGKATNGWGGGLGKRWMNLRESITDKNIDYVLSSVVVDKVPRSDERIADVTIRLTGTPFGKLSFTNVAFVVDGQWFLATPEPILSSTSG